MKPFIKKNISVELSPDTLQSTYTEIRYKKLDIEVLKFNDGSIYQQGQDFKEKTINQMTPKAKEIYAEKIKEGLGL
jgi:hypothetical protein